MSGVIKRIQNIIVTIPIGATSGTTTITSVTTANTFVTITGQYGTVSSDIKQCLCGVSLTNYNTVTATRGESDASYAYSVSVTVWEFQTSAIKSIQQHTLTLADANSNTDTITSVTTTNTFIAWGGWIGTAGTNNWSNGLKAVLTNATTVTVTGDDLDPSLTQIAYYTVVEFNSGILNSNVQSGIVSIPASTATSGTATITSVNTSQAVIFGAGWTFMSTLTFGNFFYLPILALTNSTTVTASTNTSSSRAVTTDMSFFVVEFKAADVKSIQNTTVTTGASSTTGTTTISSVNTTMAAISWLGMYGSTSGYSAGDGMTDVELTNGTTLTTNRHDAVAATVTTGVQVVEFQPPSPLTQSIVKSVQNITVTIAAGATSGTQSITAVVAANSVAEWAGFNCQVASAFPNTTFPAIVLTSGTVVTAYRNTLDASNDVTVNVTVKEYAPGIIKTNQSGTIALAATTSNTGTLSTSVTLANAGIVLQGYTTTDPRGYERDSFATVVLTNTNTVTASMIGTNSTLTAYYTVIELNAGVLQSAAQKANITLSSGSSQTTNTATLTSVNAANSIVLWGGFTTTQISASNFTGPADSYPWVTLTSGTVLTATRTTGTSIDISLNVTVWEFPANVIKSSNRGSIVIPTTSNLNTQSITAVNTGLTSVIQLGTTAGGGINNQAATYMVSTTLTSSSVITANTNAGGSAAYTRTAGYEAIEYYTYSASKGNMMLCF